MSVFFSHHFCRTTLSSIISYLGVFVNRLNYGKREIWAKELSLLDKLKSDGFIENWYLSHSLNAPITDKQNSDGEYTDRAKIYSYPRELAADLHFPVSKGIWFDKYDFSGDVTPVVVGSDLNRRFKVGERFSLYNSDKEYLVIGVLERNAVLLLLGAGGNGMGLNSVFEMKITRSSKP